MNLLNNIYAVSKSSVSLPRAQFDVMLLADSPIYKAHFPGLPITPGVCIVQMVVELLSAAVGLPLKLREVKNAKFLSALTPDSPDITVSIDKIKTEDSLLTAKAEITGRESKIYAKISLQADIA